MTYREAIAEGRRLYAEAMDKAANYALFVSEEFSRPLQTVCKEIADEGWNALRHRAQELLKTAGQTPDERAARQRAKTERNRQAAAKSVFKDPEQAAKVIASLPAEALDTVYHEARLARAGEDRTPAAKQAAKARAHAAVAPIKRAVASTNMALAVQALEEALEDLQAAKEEEAITPAAFARFERVFNQVAEVMAEVRFGLPARA